MTDYYRILGLGRQATDDAIRASYLRLAKAWHPDLHPEDPQFTEQFKALQEAYRVLSRPDMREAYDEYLHGFEDEGHREDAARNLAEFGARLYQDLEIGVSLTEAALGCVKVLRLAQGLEYALQIPPGAKDGMALVLPEPGAEERLGIRLKLRIQVPSQLTRRQKKLLREFAELEDDSLYPRRSAFLQWGALAMLCLACLVTGAVQLDRRQEALQAIQRLSFGPIPGQVEEVEKLGPKAWIEAQLHPATLDDAACDKLLEAYPDITKSAIELYRASPPHEGRKQKDGMASMAQAQQADQGAKAANERIRAMQLQWESAKLTRLVASKRQLLELMTDFWFNHFNVSEQKNQDRWLFGPYERDAIRPNALGRFSDLLLATAKSPAMLAYLDNFQSTADLRYVPEGQKMSMENAQERREAKGQGKKAYRGLNENYARELMELHTLGVDGGYTQKDVIEAARILTGWSYQGPKPQGPRRLRGMPQAEAPPFEFVFRPGMHDRGTKTVLGHSYGSDFTVASAQGEGEALLSMLAHHPSTAHFLALKLCRRFVADEPSPSLVSRVAEAYLKSDTDIPSTLQAIFDSPEFWDGANYRSKVKTPLEFMVSSLRATGAEPTDLKRLDQILENMGEPLYRCEPPTGYADVASAWVSSSALLSRMNFGMQLFDPRRSPAPIDLEKLLPMQLDAKGELDALFDVLLHGEVQQGTRQVLEARLKDPEISHRRLDDRRGELQIGTLAALVLGSPEFQRR
jgi:uncharacterized protein (DUF1800 family)